jgi:tetratricopeptide (TPR) repeat protein
MVKLIQINIFFLCLLLLLFGCNEQKKNVTGMSGSSQIKDPTELIKLAVSKQETGAYDEAIDILDQVLAANALYAPAHYQKGLIYEEWDRREESLASYKKAVEINPTYNEARLGLASLYDKSVLNELALEQYLKVAETRVDDQAIHFKIALEYWYLQDIPKTAEHYIKVIEINPEHLQAHLNLISVYERMKNWKKALEEIVIVKRLAQKTNNQQAMKIAENKFKFIEGRMNLTKKDIKRKSEPPFE